MKKISIGSWAFCFGPYQDNPIPWEETLRKLKALGFDGVEVAGFSIYPSPETAPTKEDREKLVAQAKGIGIEFSGLAPNLWNTKLINTEDPSSYVNGLKQATQFANDLGIKGVLIDTVQPPEILGEIDYELALNRVVKAWKECAKFAADLDCYLAWEFEPSFAFNKPSDVFRILDEVNEDNFGICFDTCLAELTMGLGAGQYGEKELLPGGGLEMARKLKGKINHVHLMDCDGQVHHGTPGNPPIGEGYLDFDAIIPVLLDAGAPHDWWALDFCNWSDVWTVTERAKKNVDELNRRFCS